MRYDDFYETKSLFDLLTEEDKSFFVKRLSAGTDLSVKNKDGETILHKICQKGEHQIYIPKEETYQPVIDFLLEHGANANETTPDGFTPLYYYVQNGFCDSTPLPPLLIEKTSVENLNKLYDDGSYYDDEPYGGKTILSSLYFQGFNPSDVTLLVRAGADITQPDAQQKTILGNFCHTPCYGDTARYMNYLKTLLSLGAKLTPKESFEFADYVLYLSSNSLQAQVLKEIIQADAIDLTGRDAQGNTLLHTYAAHFDRGVTASHVNRETRAVILQKLLEKTDINAVNNQNETPLNTAVKVTPDELYTHGGSEEVFAYGGYNTYFYVTRLSQIQELLQAGANPHIADSTGYTPYQNAWNINHPYYAYTLEQHDKTVQEDHISPQAQHIVKEFNTLTSAEKNIVRNRLSSFSKE